MTKSVAGGGAVFRGSMARVPAKSDSKTLWDKQKRWQTDEADDFDKLIRCLGRVAAREGMLGLDLLVT